ncbi:MAG TPA: hypothetical protein VGA22_09890 [Gemmatimonadales bacterium]|jgi:hypothetical protein
MTQGSLRFGPRSRLAVTIGLAVYGFITLRDPTVYRLLDNVDLAIHEAGHLVFGLFGEFMQFAGGTLLQLLIPLAFLAYFVRRSEHHAAGVMLWWVAQNLWNISVYVRDARAQELSLVGGGEHDWVYLLDRFGLYARDQEIGRAIFATGVALYVISIVWCLLGARKRPSERPSQAYRRPVLDE